MKIFVFLFSFVALTSSMAFASGESITDRMTDKDGRTFVLWDGREIAKDRSNILTYLNDTDVIKIRWTKLVTGSQPPLFQQKKFHFKMYTVLTFNSYWQASSPLAKMPVVYVPKGEALSSQNLGEMQVLGSQIRNAVEKFGGILGSSWIPDGSQGFKITVDLIDDRSALGFSVTNSFAPASFYIQDLINSPGNTKKMILTKNDSSAEIEVQLIRK